MAGLTGRKILITRARSQSAPLSKKIRQAGGIPIEVPLLHFSLRNNQENKQLLAQLHEYAWVFFTSSNGVKFFFNLLRQYQGQWPEHLKIGVVGEKTEETLISFGHSANFIPTTYTAEVMADEFIKAYDHPGSVLLVRGNLSRDILPKALEGHVFFQSMTVYDTLSIKDSTSLIDVLENQSIDAYTFTSPSTVQAFVQLCRDHKNYDKFLTVPCVCIGPTTEDSANQSGFARVLAPTNNFTVEGMISRMISHFSEKGQDKYE